MSWILEVDQHQMLLIDPRCREIWVDLSCLSRLQLRDMGVVRTPAPKIVGITLRKDVFILIDESGNPFFFHPMPLPPSPIAGPCDDANDEDYHDCDWEYADLADRIIARIERDGAVHRSSIIDEVTVWDMELFDPDYEEDNG